jgi:hypothetical protein
LPGAATGAFFRLFRTCISGGAGYLQVLSDPCRVRRHPRTFQDASQASIRTSLGLSKSRQRNGGTESSTRPTLSPTTRVTVTNNPGTNLGGPEPISVGR